MIYGIVLVPIFEPNDFHVIVRNRFIADTYAPKFACAPEFAQTETYTDTRRSDAERNP